MNSNSATAPSTAPPALDFAAIKTRQRATWASGDYAVIGTTLQIVGESLCEAVDLCAGERVLDVACGNGNATLAAARRRAHVIGSDYVPELLAGAGERAHAEGLAVELREADAEHLPFADGSFDVVLSTFGVMFAPDQFKAAAEMARVCRPEGRIGLANWTPEGFVGQMLGVVGRYVPPPSGLIPASAWGKRDHVAALFGDTIAKLEVVRREFTFRYQSAAQFIEVFRSFYGPTHKAFGALDDAGRAALTADLEALLARHDRGNGRSLVVPSSYLEVLATRP